MPKIAESLDERIIKTVKELEYEGIPLPHRYQIRTRMPEIAESTFQRHLKNLVRDGELLREGELYALPSHKSELVIRTELRSSQGQLRQGYQVSSESTYS